MFRLLAQPVYTDGRVSKKSGQVQQVWWIVFGLQIMLAGSSFAAMETGEIDEERAEQVVPESAIEKHEEAAEVFSWATLAGLPFLLGLGLFERRSVAQVQQWLLLELRGKVGRVLKPDVRVSELFGGPVIKAHFFWLKRHPTDRTVARALLADLRMHRTSEHGAGRYRLFLFTLVTEVLIRIVIKL
jgi:hypothetical protein